MKILSKFTPLFVLFAYILTGCTSAERARITVSNIMPLMDNMKRAANRHYDIDLIKTTMPISLVQLDGFIEISPTNPHVLLHAAEANSGYAFLFLINSDKRRALKLYQKAKGYAFRALRYKNAFKGVLKKGSAKEITQFMARYHTDDVPALYFFTISWLGCIELSPEDDARVISERPKVEVVMRKMLEIDETYNYGAIHALLGTYLSSPGFGKQMEAKSHFMEAFKISESKFLAWHFLYAKNYAVNMHDRELFVKTLDGIIAAPENLLPEKRFVNETVKRNAKELLEEVNNIF